MGNTQHFIFPTAEMQKNRSILTAPSVVVSEFNFATVSGAIMHLVEIVVSWLHDFQSLFSLNYFFAPMTENETSFKLKSYRREDSVLKSPSSHYSIAVDY